MIMGSCSSFLFPSSCNRQCSAALDLTLIFSVNRSASATLVCVYIRPFIAPIIHSPTQEVPPFTKGPLTPPMYIRIQSTKDISLAWVPVCETQTKTQDPDPPRASLTSEPISGVSPLRLCPWPQALDVERRPLWMASCFEPSWRCTICAHEVRQYLWQPPILLRSVTTHGILRSSSPKRDGPGSCPVLSFIGLLRQNDRITAPTLPHSREEPNVAI